ncbi:uncharacterized protein LOC108287554 [Cebus imitator]|uniref:uncharacterized protein LOC108287554 n=1 Tax=Cebus imitator TaxID=2715852 RepID=UPI00189C28AA|nr:uncharacterized protein LOC108287554 [Cebus imitator]
MAWQPASRRSTGRCSLWGRTTPRRLQHWLAFLDLPAQLLHAWLEEVPAASWRLDPADGTALWLTSLWLVAAMETAAQLERVRDGFGFPVLCVPVWFLNPAGEICQSQLVKY